VDGDARLTERGFRAVPAAVRNAQKTYDIVASSWAQLGADMLDWKMADDDLGLIGRQAKVIDDYNAAIDTIAGKLNTGAERMRSAGAAVNDVATAYEAQDAAYYAKFGWLEKDLDGVAPPPD
jgi:hypothetical protein